MPLNKINVLQPAYYEKFACIGGACEDVCCRDWDIIIDKNTYERYRGIKDPEFKKNLPDRVKRVKDVNASPVNYAKIVLGEDGFCKYFRQDGLCEIHACHGPKYLGTVCRTYPRKCGMLQNGLWEFSLMTSCPEAIRAALFQPQPMTFKVNEIPLDMSNSLLNLCNKVKLNSGKASRFEPHAFKIRESCIDILQSRAMMLPDRLLTMGMMLSKLSGLETGASEEINDLLEKYVSAAKAGVFSNALSDTADKTEIAADMKGVLVVMASQFAPFGRMGRLYRLMVDAMSDFVPEDGEVPFAEMLEKLEELVPKYWTPFLKERGHILENYFVNYVFSSVFPFRYCDELDVYQHFIILAEQYALMRMIFCVCAEKEGSITDELIITIITGMTMYSEHSRTAKNVADLYVNRGFDSLAYMSFLLK